MKKIFFFDAWYSKFSAFLIGFVVLLSYCHLGDSTIFYKGVRYVSLAISTLIIIIYVFNNKYSMFTIQLLIYSLILALASFIGNESTIWNFVNMYYRIIAITLYLDYGLKRYNKNIIKSFYWIFFILVSINFFTIIKYPNGWYTSELYTNNWFFEYDNTHIFMYMPAILFSFLNTKINNKITKITNFILFIEITYSVYYCFSANSVVAYTLLLSYFILKCILNKFEILNARNYFFTYIGIFFGIIIFRIQDIFSWLIVRVLGKTLTFSNRTYIWDRVIKLIKNKWILGYGQEPVTITISKLGNAHFTHAHNTILDVIYKCGILGLVAHLILLILSVKELYESRYNEISKAISAIIFCMFIMMIFEARQEKIGLYIVFVSAYHIKDIIKEKMIERNVKV